MAKEGDKLIRLADTMGTAMDGGTTLYESMSLDTNSKDTLFFPQKEPHGEEQGQSHGEEGRGESEQDQTKSSSTKGNNHDYARRGMAQQPLSLFV